MNTKASSVVTTETDSSRAAEVTVRALAPAFGAQSPKVVIVYASVTHDQPALLRGLRAGFGPETCIVGCSVQGVAGNGQVREGGYVVGAMALGGDSLRVGAAVEHEIQRDASAKGKSLGAKMRARLGEEPKVTIVLYDPLCHVDVEEMLDGLKTEIATPMIGGGAGAPFGRIVRTFQYWQDETVEHAAIALGLSGPFDAEIGVCHGTSPTGWAMTVTKSDKNALLEIDGRPAVEAWCDVIGASVEDLANQDSVSHWAIGVQRKAVTPTGDTQSTYFVRAAFNVDLERKAVILAASIPAGTQIMLHHRTADAVTAGTAEMGRAMATRLGKRRPWAVLGFECGARTSPFLGEEGTLKENLDLQQSLGSDAPWLGMMAWGEIAPAAGAPASHNYTYPLLVLAE